jgi:alkylation response protein AidB-like acyl-CoA dehydrogenase
VLAPAVVDALHRDGLFEMWLPMSVGGAELSPLKSLEVLAATAYGDPAAGWVQLAACLSTAMSGAYLSEAAVGEMFSGTARSVVTGQGTRPGRAVRVEGGFRLSGSWSFASGIKHSTHVLSLAVVEESGEPRMFVVPIDAVKQTDDWDVLGLRATASVDYEMDEVFVPEAYTHFAFVDRSERGGALYSLGPIGMALLGHSGWAIGVGRRLLDELASYARTKPGTDADGAFHAAYARAEGRFRAGAALVAETWRDVEASMGRGEPISNRQHTLIRLALCMVTDLLSETSAYVYRTAGTSALRRGTLQRLTRDVHAGIQHVTSGSAVLKETGRDLAGMVADATWMQLGLVQAPAA